jgi:hypothetical protein
MVAYAAQGILANPTHGGTAASQTMEIIRKSIEVNSKYSAKNKRTPEKAIRL